jgi:hypothetical protein
MARYGKRGNCLNDETLSPQKLHSPGNHSLGTLRGNAHPPDAVTRITRAARRRDKNKQQSHFYSWFLGTC